MRINSIKNCHNSEFVSQSLKFAEDQILRTLFDVEPYQLYFNEVLAEERAFNISYENIKKWHAFLMEYLVKNVSCQDLTMKYFDLHEPDSWFIKRWFFSRYYGRKISLIVASIVNEKQFKDIKDSLLNFYTQFSDKLASS